MGKEIKIFFVDFEANFDVNSNFFTKFLSNYYTVIIDTNPDYLFYSCYGYNHFKYDKCVKIFFTGENIVPDFNICDYGIGFHHLQLEDRYFRFPLYLMYAWEQLGDSLNFNLESEDLKNRNFCNFIYSNSKVADPFRELFFRKLSKYKKVDSGGRYLNNINKRVINKLDFIKNYKFTIAIENSAVSGYVTEKIIEPIISGSMPIYYGDPTISKDFNTDSFIHIRDYETIESAIEAIMCLDQDDDAYIEKMRRAYFTQKNIKKYYSDNLLLFFDNIFRQPLNLAKRAPIYGCARNYRRDQYRVAPFIDNLFFKKGWGLIEKLKKG